MEAGSAQKIWETALGELQVQVSKHNYQTWLAKTSGLSYQDNQFVIGAPNTFVTEYLDKNQRSLIEKTLIGLTQRAVKVHFQVNGANQHTPQSYKTTLGIPHMLNPKYTFDSFVEGSCNRLAYAAALGTAKNPGQTYNPLFIYGGVGLGKTHLLHAIAHLALGKHLQVRLVSGERFTNEFIMAIRERQTEEFRQKYRTVDMLLLDDIHFVSGKEQTEESLFHTFNELHNTNRQIVVTSNQPPKSIPRLTERLRSRFEWGLIVDIQPPDFDTRLAILQAKAKLKGESITLDVLEFIAQQIEQNVRELEGSLNRVIAYARLFRATATPDLAAKALENIATKIPKNTLVTPVMVIETVAKSFNLAPADLKSLKRNKEIASARQVAMYLIREETNYPLAQIGKELGNRNPSTVRHAYEKISAEINVNPHLKRRISKIRQQVLHNKAKP